MNPGLTSHQQRGHTETGPRFKVSSERPEKRGIDLATPGLVVQRVIHYTTAAPYEGEGVKSRMYAKSAFNAKELVYICCPMKLVFTNKNVVKITK